MSDLKNREQAEPSALGGTSLPDIRLTAEERADLEANASQLLLMFRLISPEPPAASQWQPDRPVVAEINAEQIDGIVWKHELDPSGRHIEKISTFIVGKHYAFDQTGVRQLDALAERFALHRALDGLSTTDAMRQRLMRWCELSVQSTDPLSGVDSVLSQLRAELGRHEIWVQISGIDVEEAFPMGKTVIAPVDAALVDRWSRIQCLDPSDTDALARVKQLFVTKWQGHTAAVYSAVGDKAAVKAAAIEHAERACALLRVIDPKGSNPTGRSFVQPITFISQARLREVLTNPQAPHASLFGGSDTLEPPSYGVTKEALPLLWTQALFAQAHQLLSTPQRSSFQDRLLGAVLIAARQRLTTDPIEKLIFTISSMETMLYADDPGARQDTLKRRLSGLLAGTANFHEHVFKTVKDAFNLRRQFLHHGHRIDDLTAVEAFLLLSWCFFRALLVRQIEWSTVGDFCAAMDRDYQTRFGTGSAVASGAKSQSE